jgi:hypothetical protein
VTQPHQGNEAPQQDPVLGAAEDLTAGTAESGFGEIQPLEAQYQLPLL